MIKYLQTPRTDNIPAKKTENYLVPACQALGKGLKTESFYMKYSANQRRISSFVVGRPRSE